MTESLSVENQMLLLCARRHCDAAALGALLEGVDWDALLAAARTHHLLPLLYERLKGLDNGGVPAAVMAGLQSAYYTNLLRNQRLAADLAEVVTALRGAGVEAIVLKGGALARTVYAHPAQRPMADLDLLVRPADAECADAVLRSLGFRLPTTLSSDRVRFRQQFGGGLEWYRSCEGRTTNFDLHHHLVGVGWWRPGFPVEPDALWQAARPLALDGVQTWQLSAEDTLIHLCLHLALHHRYECPLLSYADIDRVVVAPDGAFSWSRLTERAEQFRVKTAVRRGLHCSHRLLETPVPSKVLAALRPGGLHLRILQFLAPLDPGAVLQRTKRQPGVLRRILLYATLADDTRAVGSMVQSLLFPGEEWLIAHYALETRGQTLVYRLVHPLHLAWVVLQGLHRPLGESSLE